MYPLKSAIENKNRGPPPRFSHNPKYPPQKNLKMTLHLCCGLWSAVVVADFVLSIPVSVVIVIAEVVVVFV